MHSICIQFDISVRANIECYTCPSGDTCTKIEEIQDKKTCQSGWENCGTKTTSTCFCINYIILQNIPKLI